MTRGEWEEFQKFASKIHQQDFEDEHRLEEEAKWTEEAITEEQM